MKIVLCYPVSAPDLERIQGLVPDAVLIPSDQGTIAKDLFSADIFCGHAKVPVDWPRVVGRGNLQWIQSTAAGLDHCLVPAVIDSPIVVSGASGLFADQVAEQTLALVYGMMRSLPSFFRAQQEKTFERLPVDDLRTKRVLVLGCGGNGQRICQLLAPACRELVATDFFPGSIETGGRYLVEPAGQTERLMAWADLVISVLPLTGETRDFFDFRRLSLIRPGGYFINVGRGKLVVESALVQLLCSGHLRGAGLDVFVDEPPAAECPFWSLPNVIMTPHVGAQGSSRYSDATSLFCENLRRTLKGQTLINLVDKQLGMPLPENRLPPNWRSCAWASES